MESVRWITVDGVISDLLSLDFQFFLSKDKRSYRIKSFIAPAHHSIELTVLDRRIQSIKKGGDDLYLCVTLTGSTGSYLTIFRAQLSKHIPTKSTGRASLSVSMAVLHMIGYFEFCD